MTTTSRIRSRILITAFFLPLATTANPPASNHIGKADTSVLVIRGGHEEVESDFRQVSSAIQPADAVIVMRPAPGSFLRETSRLAAEAADREEQAAQDDARTATTRLTEAMQALEAAIGAGQSQLERERVEVFFLVGDQSRVPRAPRNHAIRPAARAPLQ
jgi:hypothetical protein